MSRGRAFTFRLAAVVLGCGAALLASELIAAVGLHFLERDPALPQDLRATVRSDNPRTATIPDPYLGYRVRPGFDDGMARANALGLRGDDVEATPRPGDFRILLLGGSTAWSHAARSDEETLAVFLQETLARQAGAHTALRGRRVEVLNGGVPGYVSWQSALAYSTTRRSLGPHAVISLDGANDISSALRTGLAGVPMRFDAKRRTHLGGPPQLLPFLRHWIASRVQRSKSARFLRALHPAGVEARAPPEPARVAAAYRAATLHLATAARADGVLSLSVFQPQSMLAEGKPVAPFEREINRREDARMPGRTAYFAACARAIRELFSEREGRHPELIWMDASGVFAGETDTLFTDPTHLTPRGRRLLAGVIGDRLLAAIDENPSSVSWWR